MTRAAVGYSEITSSHEAGAEAAQLALGRLDGQKPDVVLLFGTAKHDPARLREGVRSVVGPEPPLFGGAAVGVITNERMGYDGYQFGVALLSSPGARFQLFIEKNLPDNEYAVGRALGAAIRSSDAGPDNLLLLYDIVKQQVSTGMSMNMATPLLQGMGELIGAWPTTAGGGTMGDMQWSPTFQWFGDSIEQQSAIALGFSGDLRMHTTILHGCKPSSPYYTITKADKNTVLELDGRPALEVIAALLGGETKWEDYPLFITLGVNNGDPFGVYNEDEYAVRLCMNLDRERGGLMMFGDDLTTGKQVQLMRRSISFDYIAQRAERLFEQIGDRRAVMAIYIDCAGRASAYSGTDREEAEEVQKVIGSRVPLLGWYVGCEIAKAGPVMQSHNWTGVLSILSASH
jgi:hypothetical protein